MELLFRCNDAGETSFGALTPRPHKTIKICDREQSEALSVFRSRLPRTLRVLAMTRQGRGPEYPVKKREPKKEGRRKLVEIFDSLESENVRVSV